MEKPYCIVDEKEYQLVYDEYGTLRFPDTKPPCANLNKLMMDYCGSKITLDDVWDEYTQTGSSFELVEGYFSIYGINNHTVTNGDGDFKNFTLVTGNKDIDDYYNISELSVEDTLYMIGTGEPNFSREEVITRLADCIIKLKEELNICLKIKFNHYEKYIYVLLCNSKSVYTLGNTWVYSYDGIIFTNTTNYDISFSYDVFR